VDFLHQFAASLYRKRTGRRSIGRPRARGLARHCERDLFLSRIVTQIGGRISRGGRKVQFSVLPPSGGEGHWMAETETRVRLAEGAMIRALKPDASNTANALDNR
jgi:hypothetical protein